MKILKYLGYTLLVVLLLAVALVVVATIFDPRKEASVVQTLAAGGKTVHVVAAGATNFTSTASSDGIVINGTKLDLPDGDVFTATIGSDGKVTVTKGKP
jgi:hypothetical protein